MPLKRRYHERDYIQTFVAKKRKNPCRYPFHKFQWLQIAKTALKSPSRGAAASCLQRKKHRKKEKTQKVVLNSKRLTCD